MFTLAQMLHEICNWSDACDVTLSVYISTPGKLEKYA
jgi:hypothetical protein